MAEDAQTAKQKIYTSEALDFHFIAQKIVETMKEDNDVTHLSFYNVERLAIEYEDVDVESDDRYGIDEHTTQHGRAYHFELVQADDLVHYAPVYLRSEEIYLRGTLVHKTNYLEGSNVKEKFFHNDTLYLEKITERHSSPDGSTSQSVKEKHFDGHYIHPHSIKETEIGKKKKEHLYKSDFCYQEFKEYTFQGHIPSNRRIKDVLRSEVTYNQDQLNKETVTFKNGDVFYTGFNKKGREQGLKILVTADGVIDKAGAWILSNGHVETEKTSQFLRNLNSIQQRDQVRFWADRFIGGKGDIETPQDRALLQIKKAYTGLEPK